MENSILNNISNQINRYGSIVIFLFGVIGNVLNIIVLGRKPLRRNPCAWLFLVASIINTLAIVSGITTRMLSGWAADPTATISWLCKIRTYIMLDSRVIAPWLLVLAMIDRWLVSSLTVSRRRWSALKYAQWSAVIVTIVASLLFVHIFYCYEANQSNAPLKCYYRNSQCSVATDIIAFVMMIFFPTSINAIFSLMTIWNIRRSHRRIMAMNGVTSGIPTHETMKSSRTFPTSVDISTRLTAKRIDRDLMRMLLAQVLLLIVFALPLICEKIYSTIRPKKPPLEASIGLLFYNVAVLCSYLTNGMPFYIYTLFGGKIFRRSLIQLFRKH